jgi:two-component system phosphate regulon response regulator OmpR
MNWKILAIDDDPEILKMVRQYLEEDNHKVYTAASGQEAIDSLKKQPVDVVLLDMVLPDFSGLALLGEIRKISTAPVIVVSGKGETADRVVGLEMGADDYITKPFHLRELSARIKSVLRRTGIVTEAAVNEHVTAANGHKNGKEVIEFNGWRMDCGRYEIYNPENENVPLTTGEFNLLKVMVDSANRAMSRDHLLDVTRGEEYDSFDRALDIQINRLRRKLGDDPRSPRLIKTVRGVGYMFIGDVKRAG